MESRNSRPNSSYNSRRVRYADDTEDHESREPIEGDNYSGISETSKSSIKHSGDANSAPSVDTSILDVEEVDVRLLRRKLEDYEYKIRYLENENKQINDNLLSERKRTAKLENKLQFVKDNQEVFMRLKEAYINMKYNEAAGRKMIEIREKGMQTWEGTICSSCIESEELRRQIDILIHKYSELFVVSPGEMEHLLNTVKYLKDLIDRREESWTFCMTRDQKLQNLIAVLENENGKLRELIAKRENEQIPSNVLEEVQLDQQLLEEKKADEMQKFTEGLNKELERLKKIIMKYEKQFREIKERNPGKYISPLNEKEMKVVYQVITKHNAKIQKKTIDGAVSSRSLSIGSVRSRQCRRPSSPLRSSRDASVRRPKSPQVSDSGKNAKNFDKKTDSAIMMMDYLFE